MIMIFPLVAALTARSAASRPSATVTAKLAAAKAETANLQADLDRDGWLRLPPGITEVTGLKIPANGMIEGSGGELHCPAGYSGPAIICSQPGFRIVDVTIRGFHTGIFVNASQPADGTGESMIRGCRVYDYVGGVGIDWNALSDGYVSETVVANTIGSKGGSILPPYNFGAITTNTARAAIMIGPGAGGLTVARCHTWGNNLYDIADYAPDSILSENRMEGGRDVHLLLAAARIRVTGGRIWDPMKDTRSAAIQLGAKSDDTKNAFKYAATWCVIDQVGVGGDGTMPGGILRFVKEGHNQISIVVPGPKLKAPPLPDHHPEDRITIRDLG